MELLVTVLLAQNRQPPPTDAAGVPHDEFVAELISLPSGLLAMVCEAIGKLKVRLGPAGVRVRVGCTGDERGPKGSRRVQSGVGAVLASLGMAGPYAECWEYYL